MTKKDYLKYLRSQAYWITELANQVEAGAVVTCEWCIDLPLPELDREERAREWYWKAEKEIEEASA